MKKIQFIALAFAMSMFCCQKTKPSLSAVVVKDCTGVYLQYGGADHLVCNDSKLEKFEGGTKVIVDVSTVSECNNSKIVCLMYHAHEDIVNVNAIEKN